MKRSGALPVLVLVLATLPGAAALAQDVYQARILPKTDPLFGTWVNEEYSGNALKQQWQKWVLYSWGFGERYAKIADTEGQPHPRFTFFVVEKWTDSAGRGCYKALYQENTGKLHFLYRVSKDGSTLEIMYRSAAFPSEGDLGPGNPGYWTYRRQ